MNYSLTPFLSSAALLWTRKLPRTCTCKIDAGFPASFPCWVILFSTDCVLWSSAQFLFLRFVYLELPAAAKTPCTRFRWWQPVFSGEGYDQWAIDDIIILSEKQKHIIPVVNPTLPQVISKSRLWASPQNRNYPVRRLVWIQFSLKILVLFKETAVVFAAASLCRNNLGLFTKSSDS